MRKLTRSEDVRGKEIALLKKEYFREEEEHTPSEIKKNEIFDINNPHVFKLRLTKELIEKWNLKEWLTNYKKEALVSTAGVRGAQNILYPWDTRFRLNHLGVVLATLAKAKVLKTEIKRRAIHKICAGEVRYNTEDYIKLITRVQAAEGIVTHITEKNHKTSIWMTSFLTFMQDYDGGEYVTSSHAVSSKIATKDLDSQGSQFVPDESAKFVEQIQEILDEAEKKGYEIDFAEANSPLIIPDVDGTDLYVNYLKNGVATDVNIELIKNAEKKGLEIMYECLGCMYTVMMPIMKKLEIDNTFVWNNTEPDPFFHGVGKVMLNPVTKKKEFFDYGCDTTLKDVELTLGYEKLLKNKPTGYFVLMVDPDGDRIVLGQVEPTKKKKKLESLGIEYIPLTKDKIFAYYSPDQAFLLIMDFHAQQLKAAGLWNKHPRFIIKTTASADTWMEWAKKMDVKVINTPVGFKEIASIMEKIERKLKKKPKSEIVVKDILGNNVNLGVQPRLLFAGEESGGMITGPEELIKSKKGKVAIAMREKSAGEASILVTALAAKLHLEKRHLSDYLEELFNKYEIVRRFDVRKDLRFYNESEADPAVLKKDIKTGEIQRDLTDSFFLSIALAFRAGELSLPETKEILTEAIPMLDFSDLKEVLFVGDGTYFEFANKFVEIRKSGTDAIIKCYSAGTSKAECIKYSETIATYNGALTPKFKKYISTKLYQTCHVKALKILRDFQDK